MFREAFFLIFLLMALALLATRGGIRDFTGRKIDFVYTIVGFSALLFFQPTAGVEPNVVGVSLELIGLGLVASGFVSLNRSFGLAPENRGVKTGGAYRFVRHPMYLGYILSEGGFCFDNLPYLNLIILTISVTFLVLRLLAEERLLQRDQGYRSYAEKTRWKLVPYVF
jgi:protein-S-isoprenylcysteine O-methyltransferase Ste14